MSKNLVSRWQKFYYFLVNKIKRKSDFSFVLWENNFRPPVFYYGLLIVFLFHIKSIFHIKTYVFLNSHHGMMLNFGGYMLKIKNKMFSLLKVTLKTKFLRNSAFLFLYYRFNLKLNGINFNICACLMENNDRFVTFDKFLTPLHTSIFFRFNFSLIFNFQTVPQHHLKVANFSMLNRN